MRFCLSIFHVNYLCNNINRALCCNKLKKSFNGTLKAICFVHVHSRQTKCPVIVSCTNKTNKNHIAKVHKKAIRIITHIHYNEHISPLFVRLGNVGILPYDKILEHSKLTFMRSIEYNYVCSKSL